MSNTHLVVVDPQTDFCDPDGALYVAGADQDIRRLSEFLRQSGRDLSAIHCTLDNHHLLDIAHPLWWLDQAGKHPDPFTIIEAGAVENGDWAAADPGAHSRSLDYVRALQANGRYPLCVWPPHCLIGSLGASVMPELFEALTEWETDRRRPIDYVVKGANPWTEHYSVVQADVPDAKDPSTMLNASLVRALEEADTILLAGEAGSHCVANTARDIADNFSEMSSASKMVLLEDTTSPVPGFESMQEAFVTELCARGMRVTTTGGFSA